MPVCVIMLVEAARTSFAWQPAAPQVSGATRRSPGFTNFTNSEDSSSHFVNARSGKAERSVNLASRGWTWAFSLATLYSAEFAAAPAATETEEFPPWQSVQPRKTVFVGCIVGSSVEVWHVMQPDDLRAASPGDCPRTMEVSCFACTREDEFA